MKAKNFFLVAVLAAVCSLQSCSPSVYTNPSFTAVAKQHKTIAILPFDVKVGLRPNEMRDMTEERHYELERQHGRAIQGALQVHFLQTINKKKEKVKVQDIATTNAILLDKDIQPEELTKYTPAELAQMLGVDAVMMGSLTTDKPFSNGVAAAMVIYELLATPNISLGAPTNTGLAVMKIYDGATGSLLWNYEKALERYLGSDTNTITRAITRKAAKRIPYAKLKV
jgi:citrate lyase gamma subunit